MRVPAVFMRGGSSKGLFFQERDLPPPGADRDALLLSAMGSPDPYGRQLNGMGGGVSSLSKVIIVRPSDDDGADVEFLHGQVSVDRSLVDYSANCGNLSAAVGPFAIDEGLFPAGEGDSACLRIRNLNTGAMIEAVAPVNQGRFEPRGDFAIPGVAGTASQIALQYSLPGAGSTSALFPTGRTVETFETEFGKVPATLALATLPVIWLEAEAMGVDSRIMPDALDQKTRVMEALEAMRREGAFRMGLATSPANANQASPKLGLVGPPHDYVALDGRAVRADDFDIMARMVSMARAHKACPLTGAMCLAATTLALGTIASRISRPIRGSTVRIGTPSGVLTVGAQLCQDASETRVQRTMVYSTARRLMDGWISVEGQGSLTVSI